MNYWNNSVFLRLIAKNELFCTPQKRCAIRVENYNRFEGCGGGVSPKIARKYLIFRVTTSKKQPHTRARPPPHWMGTPSPFPLNCCKYAAGPPGRVPDALEEVPRVSGWLRSSPRTPPRVPRWCPPSVAGGVALLTF
jgi:hypothetical protein